MDDAVKREAAGHLSDLFTRIGQARQEKESGNSGGLGDLGLGGIAGQLEEFMTMPLDLAMVFLNMGMQLAELVLTSLEEAGFVLTKGMTPL